MASSSWGMKPGEEAVHKRLAPTQPLLLLSHEDDIVLRDPESPDPDGELRDQFHHFAFSKKMSYRWETLLLLFVIKSDD